MGARFAHNINYAVLLLISLLLHAYSIQTVLKRGSIDKLLTFDVGLIYTTQFSYQSVHRIIHATCGEEGRCVMCDNVRVCVCGYDNVRVCVSVIM